MAKKARKPIFDYMMSSGIILAISLMFSVISLVFLATPGWVQFLISFVFMAPILFLSYSQGKTQGEKIYKKSAETSLTNLHNGKGIYIPKQQSILHLLFFAVPLLILTLLCVILNNSTIHFILCLFVMPAMIMFSSINAISATNLNWAIILVYTLYILIICGAFIFGYMRRIHIMKKQQRDIEGELRMFNN